MTTCAKCQPGDALKSKIPDFQSLDLYPPEIVHELDMRSYVQIAMTQARIAEDGRVVQAALERMAMNIEALAPKSHDEQNAMMLGAFIRRVMGELGFVSERLDGKAMKMLTDNGIDIVNVEAKIDNRVEV